VDRLHALGNAVVPQCAEVIGHIVQEFDNALQECAVHPTLAAINEAFPAREAKAALADAEFVTEEGKVP